jgi:hypothetical protein
MCELLGIEHGVNWEKIIDVGNFISHALNRENLSTVTIEDLDSIDKNRSYIYEEE